MPQPPLQSDKLAESSALLGADAVDRPALRRAKIAAREALPPAQHRNLSQAIDTHLANLLQRCQPRVLGFCWPFRAEFDCRPLVIRLLETGVRACLPLAETAETSLKFRAWRKDSEMLIDRYGIHFPAAGELLTPDVLLMPVNAFDNAGFRLGYGAGYFDRTLAELAANGLHPLAIGVGFELARVASINPAAHDIPLDAVVTENGATAFSTRARDLLK
ncbi:MAG: 5-formyltetrahydrofolate cyclo-ligase [Sterolibacterium sp.]|nr:5-formyltetrahydrofolate cyclo-ligase [Sterolibacterium sp.]